MAQHILAACVPIAICSNINTNTVAHMYINSMTMALVINTNLYTRVFTPQTHTDTHVYTPTDVNTVVYLRSIYYRKFQVYIAVCICVSVRVYLTQYKQTELDLELDRTVPPIPQSIFITTYVTIFKRAW